ncbi:MAG: hypothetical protein A2513_02240 [Sulfurimonas sp. RIFOXYD12_FULL_33_39]|uniref:energy transducer TonB n=1 Tax=unclassified Sulfurimonas TaxID=2623549 RepID=UPI0008C521AD|nr:MULTISPECIES: energy transducer TonB [unclassified Sulfurimonas]OHE06751.1 MAG: hypothetical protein A3G74_09685 [Sulfurimonas sp. RIFCSPLOWO2_12_FULL_34_6]OHE08826.1 MAG: hypothetical protein A2513_02240 [Sulfurimonas sp. RIFOXYD12_FULL_33_39]OHE14136.1 MAG: hypothetical protein A2530_05540 [Sulfurimonas sp. RIFOXYD2_FULL_34_21]DAB28610.1 MAG TPA: hypothetical protein CFH78_01685 [Sulfurimonas sp. UBA10385]
MLVADKNSINGFSISFILHILVAYVLFYVLNNKMDFPKESSVKEMITISLGSFEELKEVVQKIEMPKPIVQSIVKNDKPTIVKPIEKKTEQKIEQKVQEIIQTKVVEAEKKVEVTQETVGTKVEPKEEVANQVQQHVEPTPQVLEAEFVKTNFQSIRDMVLANLKYPNIARRMGQAGIVELLLVIDTKGKLVDISVYKSSGHKLLDNSAISAAGKLCAEALPIPQTISKVTLPIYFALN